MRRSLLFLIVSLGAVCLVPLQTSGDGDRFDLAQLRATDTFFARAFDNVAVQDAWRVIRESSSGMPLTPVRIGIMDTGVELRHPDFENVQFGFGAFPRSAVERDAVIRRTGHGTAVTGIIGANNIADDEGGVYRKPEMNGILSGALSEAQYTLELSPTALPSFDHRVGLRELLGRAGGVSSVNMSFGHCARSFTDLERCLSDDLFLKETRAWSEFFAMAQEEFSGVLFIVAAGNFDTVTAGVTPANVTLLDTELDNIIVVGAVDLSDGRASFPSERTPGSQFGRNVDIAAPGVHVYAPTFFTPPLGDDDYLQPDSSDVTRGFSGTSAAAPLVTGAAGLIKAVRPELSPVEIKDILITTADPIQTGEPNKRLGTGCYADPDDPINTGCRLNVHAAVCHPAALDCAPPEPTLRQLTFTEAAVNTSPAVSPEGERIAFLSSADHTGENPERTVEVYGIDPGGTSLLKLTAGIGSTFGNPGEFLDIGGDTVVVRSNGDPVGMNPDGWPEIFAVNTDGTDFRQLTQSPEGTRNESVSITTNGQWIAFVSTGNYTGENALARKEIFLVHADGTTFRQITHGFGLIDIARISGDGSTIAFTTHRVLGQNRGLHVLDVASGEITFSVPLLSTRRVFSLTISDNGEWIAFSGTGNLTGENPTGRRRAFAMRRDGSEVYQIGNVPVILLALSGDGSTVAVSTSGTIILTDITGNNPRTVFDNFGSVNPTSFTPDASLLAFEANGDPLGTNGDGNFEIFTLTFPEE